MSHSMMQYLLKGFVGTFLLSIFLSISTLPAANANEVQKALDTVASKLVTKLPMSKKIALKSLSPDETGLPADFLRKLTSDLESYLLKASNFEAKILNRQVTEDVWGEAIEFGDARFQELYAASEASILVLLSPRITPTGLELSASAYELKGEFSGNVIASSGSISVEADLEKLLGINVNTISDDIDSIRKELDILSQEVGLVYDPQKFSDYVHNSEINIKNKDYYSAISNLEQALNINPKFTDITIKLGQLLLLQFGKADAIIYVQKQLKSLPPEQYTLILLALDEDAQEIYLNNLKTQDTRNYSPGFWAFWIQRFIPEPSAILISQSNKSFCKSALYFAIEKGAIIEQSIYNGEFKNEWLNPDLGLMYSINSLNNSRFLDDNQYVIKMFEKTKRSLGFAGSFIANIKVIDTKC